MTTSYYDIHADDFVARTCDVDISAIRDVFTGLLPAGSAILDAGCGSGRDTKAFLDARFKVTAFDASERMVEIAKEVTGADIAWSTFLEFKAPGRFNGIWACASLLHVPRGELMEVVAYLASMLEVRGCLYASFKFGEDERVSDGRYFNDMTPATFEDLITPIRSLEVERYWITPDARPDVPVQWLNTISRRTAEHP
jgi:SAM-dependent methyltransferase